MDVPSVVRAALFAAVVGLLAPPGAPAADCTIDCAGTQCVCSGTDPLCEIVTRELVPPGAVIDCAGRNVVVRGTVGLIDVLDGTFTLRAHDLTVATGRFLRARRSKTGTAPVGMILDLTGRLDVQGYLDVDARRGGGDISIETGGDLSISRSGSAGYGVFANGESEDAPGGTVHLVSGGNVVIAEPIMARAHSGVASGGNVDVTAAGNITVTGTINVLGRNAPGGTITLTAQGDITLGEWLRADGWGTTGDGGEIHLAATRVVVGAPISAQGGLNVSGGDSHGGGLAIDAGTGGVVIRADLLMHGGADGAGLDGGAIAVDSEGPLTVANGVRLSTRSGTGGGNGGDIRLFSLGRMTVNGAVFDARGHAEGAGAGAAVALEACAVTIGSGAVIDARGFDGGTVRLVGREALTIAGTIDVTPSGGTAGSIDLVHRLAGACTGDPAIGCEPGECLPTGRCRHDGAVGCAADADCNPCGSQLCRDNPNLTGARFRGAAAELEENHNLESCQ
jgi:filamentous hemagglutinin